MIEMREILYRAKPLNLDAYSDHIREEISWVYGCPLINPFNPNPCHGVSVQIFEQRDGKMFNWECDPETLGQWTGIWDKNGKKIFEGDILQNRVYIYPQRDKEPITSRLQVGRVIWDDLDWHFPGRWNFCFKDEHGKYDDCMFSDGGCEVIGNIHDNPELLKE